MAEIAIPTFIIVWLMLGGWAYVRLWNELEDRSNVEGLVWLCLLLAPFAAGIALGGKFKRKAEPEAPTPSPTEREIRMSETRDERTIEQAATAIRKALAGGKAISPADVRRVLGDPLVGVRLPTPSPQ